MPKREPTFEPVDLDEGELLSWDEFVDDVHNRRITDYDGFGQLATETEVSDVPIDPSDLRYGVRIPAWCTHVMWYDR